MAALQLTRKQKLLSPIEWQEVVQRLAEQITDWAQQEDWTIKREEARVLDGYPIPPTLVIETPKGRLKLELPTPEAYTVLRPKLYVWPGLYRVWLSHQSQEADWQIWTDSGIPLHEEWNRMTFMTLANDPLNADNADE